MAIIDEISRDLDWREAEIASMRLLLLRSDLSEKQLQTLLRAAWALLYAHYEGFCKNCLTLFFEEISNRGFHCGELPTPTRVFALEKAINHLRSLPNADFVAEIANFSVNHLDAKAVFPSVDTGSNLWPNTLINLMMLADLDTREIQNHAAKIKTLVARRNGIAHGEKSFIAEFNYYHGYEEAVYAVIYDLAFQVDQRLNLPPYS